MKAVQLVVRTEFMYGFVFIGFLQAFICAASGLPGDTPMV